jgi:hypothetical protein
MGPAFSEIIFCKICKRREAFQSGMTEPHARTCSFWTTKNQSESELLSPDFSPHISLSLSLFFSLRSRSPSHSFLPHISLSLSLFFFLRSRSHTHSFFPFALALTLTLFSLLSHSLTRFDLFWHWDYFQSKQIAANNF